MLCALLLVEVNGDTVLPVCTNFVLAFMMPLYVAILLSLSFGGSCVRSKFKFLGRDSPASPFIMSFAASTSVHLLFGLP